MLGIENPPRAWIAFAYQVKRETANGADWAGGARNNNPLNLTTAKGTIRWPNQTGTWGGGSAEEPHDDFASFGTLEDGAYACALNYTGGLYPRVLRAFREGDPLQIAEEIERSPWDSGNYGWSFADQVRDELGTEDEVTKAEWEAYKTALQEELKKFAYDPLTQNQLDIGELYKRFNDLLTRVGALELARPGHKHRYEGETK